MRQLSRLGGACCGRESKLWKVSEEGDKLEVLHNQHVAPLASDIQVSHPSASDSIRALAHTAITGKLNAILVGISLIFTWISLFFIRHH